MRILSSAGATFRALPVLAVLLAASAGILSSTFFADRAVRMLALQSLESTARGISLAAEQVLKTEDGRGVQFERLFSDLIVAYALIAAADGTVLFHTNPDLRGTPFDDTGAFGRLAVGATASRRALLGTGRPVLRCGARRLEPVLLAWKYPGASECRGAGGHPRPGEDRFRTS